MLQCAIELQKGEELRGATTLDARLRQVEHREDDVLRETSRQGSRAVGSWNALILVRSSTNIIASEGDGCDACVRRQLLCKRWHSRCLKLVVCQVEFDRRMLRRRGKEGGHVAASEHLLRQFGRLSPVAGLAADGVSVRL